MNVLIFGGTTEGRELFEKLLENHRVTLSVAEEYGKGVFQKNHDSIRVGRLDENQMQKLILDCGAEAVFDATHPYAKNAHEKIKIACENAKIPLLRFCRKESEEVDGVEKFDSLDELLEAVSKTRGNVFVATGSKDISQIVEKIGAQRIFARVIPSEKSIRSCLNAGVFPARIIAMQGPFSARLNEAIFLETGAKILITKLSGKSGGEDEKILAAKTCRMRIFALARPNLSNVPSVFSLNAALLWLDSLKKKQ